MRSLVLGLAASLGLTLVATSAPAGAVTTELAHPGADHSTDHSTHHATHHARAAVPQLRVRRLVTGLDHPWDVRPIGNGRLLYTQRERATVSVWRAGHKHKVRFPSRSIWTSGETGLMGLEVDPNFAQNRRFYTCQGGFTGHGHDVRVISWRLNRATTRARWLKRLVGGFPTSSGRHGGCRLLIARDGSLLVGTGDAAQGTNPENKSSLGGKTLRLNRFSGAPWPTNPFVRSANHNRRYVHTYGHRNVQGLAQRSDGSLWSIEQGTYRDDEVNRLVNGGDYGYNPVPGYNESVPMTDQSLPGTQIRARWRSGDPTLAASGGTFVGGKRWGALNGTLAVATLKASRVLFLSFDRSGRLTRTRVPSALRQHGRIRTVVDGAGPVLYVTTDNGDGHDAILAVRPRR